MAAEKAVKHGGNPKIIQVQKEELDNLVLQYGQVYSRNKKLEAQIKAYTNLSEVITRQEQSLRVNKKKAQQFESAYIASESKLAQCIQMLIQSKREGKPPDVEVIENLLHCRSDDLYTSYFPQEEKSKSSKSDTFVKKDLHTKGTVDSVCDLEEDCEEDLEEDCENDTKNMKKADAEDKTKTSEEFSSAKADAHTTNSSTVKMVSRGLTIEKDLPSKLKTNKSEGKSTRVSTEHKVRFADIPELSETDKSIEQDSEALIPDAYKGNIIKRLISDKKQLQTIIKEYELQDPEGWKSFLELKRYEELIKNLRLEVANERIHNSQLQMILAAKQGGNIDALTKKIAELDKQVQRLNKQLLAKHALLHSLNGEYQKLKAENGKLSKLFNIKPSEEQQQKQGNEENQKKEEKMKLPDGSTDIAGLLGKENSSESLRSENESSTQENSGQSGVHSWKEEYSVLKDKYEQMVVVSEKEKTDMFNVMAKLKDENEKLLEECKSYSASITEMKDNRLCVGDEDVNVSWTQLKEENERLQNEVTAYKHELESNKKDNDLLEAQMKMSQEDYEKEITARKKESEENEELRSKYQAEHNQLSRKQGEVISLQKQFEALHLENEKLKSIIQRMRMPQQQPHRPPQQCFDNTQTIRFQYDRAILAGTLQTDGSPEPSPKTPPSEDKIPHTGDYRHNTSKTLQQQHSYSAPAMTRSQEPMDKRVVAGSESKGMVMEVLECPQCYREFKAHEREKFADHCKKCMTG